MRAAWSSLMLAVWASCLPQVASADCPLCNGNYECSDNCLERCCNGRPNKIKIVIKRPIFASPLHGVAAAPVGYAMPSVGAAFVIPTAAAPASAGLSAADARLIADELRKANATAAAPASAAASKTCDDPCGEIKQLRADVDRLIDQMNRLAPHVETLARESKERRDREKNNGQ